MKHYASLVTAMLVLFVIFGTMYVMVQQDQRSDANSPQIQLAEETAALLNQGMDPANLTQGTTNMAKSLAPFVNIYDKAGKVVSGSGYLNGNVPMVPHGMLQSADGQVYFAETWEPAGDVRIAAVVVQANKYYVVSGSSLTQVEKNENRTLDLALFGGAIAWAIVLSMTVVFMKPKPKKD